MQEKQLIILDSALEIVPFDGWSEATLRLAAKNAGLDENYAKIAFKKGAIEAVAMFLRQVDANTYAKIDSDKLNSMKIRERIFYILNSRFEVMEESKAVIRKTVQFLAMPQNLCHSTKLLWEMADNAWYKAGDISVDYNHYTKRATLIAVYSSSLLFWLNDDSGNLRATSEFIKRRIENVMQFESVKGKILKTISAKKWQFN